MWTKTDEISGGGHVMYRRKCDNCPKYIVTRKSRTKNHGGVCRSCNLTVRHPMVRLKEENKRLKEEIDSLKQQVEQAWKTD